LSATTQTFHHLAADQTIIINEGSNSFEKFRQPRFPIPQVGGPR
jgi:hypothetical protein